MASCKAAKSKHKVKASPLKNFQKQIRESLKDSRYHGRPQAFLPESSVSELVTEEKVKELLPEASSSLVQFVCNDAKKVFLTLAYINPHSIDFAKATECFRQHGLTDKLLPIDDITRKGNCDMTDDSEDSDCSEGGVSPPCHHHAALNAFHDWKDSPETRRFYDEQWMFISPVFRESEAKQTFHESSILPFTWVNKERKYGHFSDVSEAKLRADHQDKIKQTEDHIHVAIKVLKPLSKERGYNVEKAWHREIEALDKIGELRHPHLINCIAAFKLGAEHVILFEWADGGSLREIWESKPKIHERLDKEKVMRLLEEFLGLADALCALHSTNRRTKTAMAANSNNRIRREAIRGTRTNNDVTISVNNADSPNGERGTDNLPDDDSDVGSEGSAEERHWRHGDLKPDNILKFKGSGYLGTLKIADLGLAKQHEYATNARFERTDTKHATLHYEAPEASTKSAQPRSRRHDIWSMGCIILESLIWLLYGYDVLETFLKQSEHLENSRDTLYFTTSTNSQNQPEAEVSDVSRAWIKQMLKQDPECDRSRTATGDLLGLVQDKLLVIALPGEDDPTAQCRADASTLWKELNRIWARAMNDDKYLFTGIPRRDVKVPTPFRQPSSYLALPAARKAQSQHLNVR